MTEKFTLFWGGPFSQWYRSKFVIASVKYNCAEQFMMAEKARLFNDPAALDEIMKSSDPGFQKAVGRKIKGFDKTLWESNAKLVVYRANMAKFGQDKEMYDELYMTGGTTLVEASPYDKIWGIGLAENDPRCLDRSQWQGTNWLGEVLNLVRKDLMGF